MPPPPNRCISCGAEAKAGAPCPQCERIVPSGTWTQIELPDRVRHQRQRALASAAGGLFVAMVISTLAIILVALSGQYPRGGDLAFRGFLLLVTMGIPLGGYSIVMARKGVLGLLDATRGAAWRWQSDRGGLSMLAIARDDGVRWLEGEVLLRVGDDVSGASTSSEEIRRAGLRDLARALDQDARDLLVLASFAGMIARAEIRVGPSLRRRWELGQPAVEVPGWDIRATAPSALAGPIERAIFATLPPSPAEEATAPYRGGTAPEHELELAATPLSEAWKAAWAAAGPFRDEESSPRDEAADRAYVALRERLREWLAREPKLRDYVVGLGDEHRAERRLTPPPAVTGAEPRPE